MVYLIIFLTAVVSAACFGNTRLRESLMLRPYVMTRRGQWYRLITHGFVHADWMHLIVNMLVFWSFGGYVVSLFKMQAQGGAAMDANLRFLLLYLGGLVAASLYDVIKRRDNPNFASIGASGAVSAVVFTSIFYNPLGKILLMGIIPLPAVLFGLLYIGYESYAARRTGDGINHHAHLFGALYGFIFPLLTQGFSQFDIFLRGLGLQ